MTEECIERGVCTSIAKSIEPMVDPKDCQTQFKCGNSSNVDNHWDRHGEARALSISSIKRIIQTKSIRRPKDWYKSKYCHKCERKRSKCFNVSTLPSYYLYYYPYCKNINKIFGNSALHKFSTTKISRSIWDFKWMKFLMLENGWGHFTTKLCQPGHCQLSIGIIMINDNSKL